MSGWNFFQALSNTGAGGTAALTTGTIKPNIGDLIVASGGVTWATTNPSTYVISDSSSGGAAWNAVLLQQSTNHLSLVTAWKVANAADNNGGAGITVTATSAGGVGATSFHRVEADVFRPPAQAVGTPALDLSASAMSTVAISSFALNPSVGSSQPTLIDELAVTCLYTGINSNGGLTGINQFMPGAVPLTSTGFTGASFNSNFMTQYGGGAQAQAVAGNNTWDNQWTTARSNVYFGLTFYYPGPQVSSGGANFFQVMMG
jgi:hypothetical protein